jgi:hypothetical protein
MSGFLYLLPFSTSNIRRIAIIEAESGSGFWFCREVTATGSLQFTVYCSLVISPTAEQITPGVTTLKSFKVNSFDFNRVGLCKGKLFPR